jgi:hypothetical protein
MNSSNYQGHSEAGQSDREKDIEWPARSLVSLPYLFPLQEPHPETPKNESFGYDYKPQSKRPPSRMLS